MVSYPFLLVLAMGVATSLGTQDSPFAFSVGDRPSVFVVVMGHMGHMEHTGLGLVACTCSSLAFPPYTNPS